MKKWRRFWFRLFLELIFQRSGLNIFIIICAVSSSAASKSLDVSAERRKTSNLARFSVPLDSGLEISSKKQFLFSFISWDVPLRISEKVWSSSVEGEGATFSESNMHVRIENKTLRGNTWEQGRGCIWYPVARDCAILLHPLDSPLELLLWWKLSASCPQSASPSFYSLPLISARNDSDCMYSCSEPCGAWKESSVV